MKSIGLFGIGEFDRYSIIASSSASSGTQRGEILSDFIAVLPSDVRLENDRDVPLLLLPLLLLPLLLVLLESLLLPLLLRLAPLTEEPLDATPLLLLTEAESDDSAAFLSLPEEERKVRDKAFMVKGQQVKSMNSS